MGDTFDYSGLSTNELLKLEKEYSRKSSMLNTKQLGLKILLNSLYGATGNVGFRYFNLHLATSITLSGQLAIRWIEKRLNDFLNKKIGIKKDRVVLIDTDSVMLNLKDLVDVFCPKDISREKKLEFLDAVGKKVFNPFIDKSYRQLAEYTNAFAHKFHMKRENIVNAMIIVAAKNYLCRVWDSEGVRYSIEEPYNKIMGLQMIKASMGKEVQKAMKDAIPILTEGQESELQDYIKKVKSTFNTLSVEDIAFPRGVTQISKFSVPLVKERIEKSTDINEIKQLEDFLDTKSQIYTKFAPVHVKAGLIYNDLIERFGLTQQRQKVADNDKIKFVYLRKPNPIGEEVVGFQETLPKEFGLHSYVDYDKMFEKSFLEPIRKITDALGWKTEKVSFLEDFFE